MSRSLCSKDLYCTFLQVTSQRYSAVSLSEVSPIDLSHDSISRWLADTHCLPSDIWKAAKSSVLGSTGVIVADETVLNKSRSDKIELVRWQYSGTEHDIVKGIGLLNFLWVDDTNQVCPFDYRIWEPKEDGKTKNEQFRELLISAKERGLTPKAVVADSWYSSLDNAKCIRDLGWNWVMGLRKNRRVNKDQSLCDLSIPESGVLVYLRGYGWITVFRFVAKNGHTDYYGTNISDPTRLQIESLVRTRWEIEIYHRELKQTCGLEQCQARTSRSQRNHIGYSILTWIKQSNIRRQFNLSLYRQQWNIIKPSIAYQLKVYLAMT
jgi:hypothetical protein